MLTTRQQALFKLLEWDTAHEREIRTRHRGNVDEYGADKDFTRWLTKVLHQRWASERRASATPYLGD
jgi:hypothetical protein